MERKRERIRQYGREHKEEMNAYRREYFKDEEKKKAHYKRVAAYIRRRCEADPEYREKRNAYYKEYHKKKKKEEELK